MVVRKLKDAGNKAFKDEDYGTAIAQYTEAMEADIDHEQLHVLLSNRSLTFLKSRFYREAERDAIKVIELRPNWAKGYYRLASAMYEGAQDNISTERTVDDAMRTIERGLSCEPDNKGLLKLKKKLVTSITGGDETRKPKRTPRSGQDAFSGHIVERNTDAPRRVVDPTPSADGAESKVVKEEKKTTKRVSAFKSRRMRNAHT
jgi:tetratricopeptide (TPR) repeat protein